MTNLSYLTYLLTFAEGIITFISPCILPMLPVYFVYLSGKSLNDETDSKAHKSRLLLNSIAFVIGFTIIFVALGATATSVGKYLFSNKSLLQKISGIIMIVFGLNFMGFIKLNFLHLKNNIALKFNKLGFLSSIIFGIVFGIGWSNCLGALLGFALALASNANTIYEGMLLLLVYSLGLGIPLILSAIAFDKLEGAFSLVKKHTVLINFISGILLVIAGLLVFTDTIKYLSNFIQL